LVPRGTESPRATIDNACDVAVLVADLDADDAPHAAVTLAITNRTASETAGLPRPIVAFMYTQSAGSAA
jgi:hypothetical protein